MIRSKKNLLLALGAQLGILATSSIVCAQDAPLDVPLKPHHVEPKAKPVRRTAPAHTAAPASAHTAAPAPAQAVPGAETTKFQGWTVTCSPPGQAGQPRTCVAKMGILKSKEDPRPILIMDIIKTGEKSTLVLHTPTTVDLTPGVTMRIGATPPVHLNYVSCEPALCTAAMPLDDSITKALVEGANASASWIGLGVGQVSVDYTLQEVRNAISFLATR